MVRGRKAKIKFGSRQHARFACCRCLGDEQYSACAKGAPTKQIILRNCGRRFCPSCFDSKAKIKFGSRQHARFACCRCLGDEQYSACAKGAPTKQIILRNCGRRFCPSCFDSKAKIKFGSRQHARFACCRCLGDEQYSACAKGAPTKQIILRNCGRSFCPSCFDSKDSLRG